MIERSKLLFHVHGLRFSAVVAFSENRYLSYFALHWKFLNIGIQLDGLFSVCTMFVEFQYWGTWHSLVDIGLKKMS